MSQNKTLNVFDMQFLYMYEARTYIFVCLPHKNLKWLKQQSEIDPTIWILNQNGEQTSLCYLWFCVAVPKYNA